MLIVQMGQSTQSFERQVNNATLFDILQYLRRLRRQIDHGVPVDAAIKATLLAEVENRKRALENSTQVSLSSTPMLSSASKDPVTVLVPTGPNIVLASKGSTSTVTLASVTATGALAAITSPSNSSVIWATTVTKTLATAQPTTTKGGHNAAAKMLPMHVLAITVLGCTIGLSGSIHQTLL